MTAFGGCPERLVLGHRSRLAALRCDHVLWQLHALNSVIQVPERASEKSGCR